MKTDPNLDIEIDNDVVEVGATVSGRIQRWPSDGDDNSKKIGKIQAVRVKVSWRTEGRGDRARATVGEITIPAAEFGQASGSFSVPIPPNSPISYDGSLIRVIWELEARTDRKLARDPKNSYRLLVVPRNGLGRYKRPHPLPKAGYTPGGRLDEDDDTSPFDSNPIHDMSDQPIDGRPKRPDTDNDTDDLFTDRPDYLDDP